MSDKITKDQIEAARQINLLDYLLRFEPDLLVRSGNHYKTPNGHSSLVISLQSIAQINSLYKDDADTIIDCCDTTVFLGGKSQKTTKFISETIGKETIVGRNTSQQKGYNGSYTLQDQSTGRDLLDPAEVAKIPMAKEIILMTGEKPFLDKKYNIRKHPNYNQLASVTGHPFDIERYLQHTRDLARWQREGQTLKSSPIDLSELNR